MSDAADNGVAATSIQVQSAIDQLTFLQRLLHGDDEMSLSDLLASTSASGPSSSFPSGGLSKALPALLSPLLHPLHEGEIGSYANGGLQEAMLAKRAAFQPRKYLEMTTELTSRLSDKSSEMCQAINLAQKLSSKGDIQNNRRRQKERVLLERKRRKLEIAQRAVRDEEQLVGATQDSDRKFGVLPSFHFPNALQGQAKLQEPALTESPTEAMLNQYIKAWQLDLQSRDTDLAVRVELSTLRVTHGENDMKALMAMKIDQMGLAWIWVDIQRVSQKEKADQWLANITRINILAESEVDSLNKASLIALGLQMSKFPLYRRLSMSLQTKLMTLEKIDNQPWSHLTVALFALSVLSRLHEVQHSAHFVMNDFTTLQGQDSILNAIMYLDVATIVEGEAIGALTEGAQEGTITSNTTEAGPQRSTQVDLIEMQAEQSPQSSLFSNSQMQDVPSPS